MNVRPIQTFFTYGMLVSGKWYEVQMCKIIRCWEPPSPLISYKTLVHLLLFVGQKQLDVINFEQPFCIVALKLKTRDHSEQLCFAVGET